MVSGHFLLVQPEGCRPARKMGSKTLLLEHMEDSEVSQHEVKLFFSHIGQVEDIISTTSSMFLAPQDISKPVNLYHKSTEFPCPEHIMTLFPQEQKRKIKPSWPKG